MSDPDPFSTGANWFRLSIQLWNPLKYFERYQNCVSLLITDNRTVPKTKKTTWEHHLLRVLSDVEMEALISGMSKKTIEMMNKTDIKNIEVRYFLYSSKNKDKLKTNIIKIEMFNPVKLESFDDDFIEYKRMSFENIVKNKLSVFTIVNV